MPNKEITILQVCWSEKKVSKLASYTLYGTLSDLPTLDTATCMIFRTRSKIQLFNKMLPLLFLSAPFSMLPGNCVGVLVTLGSKMALTK